MSLSDATKPLLLVSRLVGMNPKSNWHKIYPVFIIVSQFLILYCIWQFLHAVSVKNNHFNIMLYALEECWRIFSMLIILGAGLFDRKRFMVPLKDFASVDQSLKSITGFIENKDTYRFQILLVIFVGLMILLFGFVDLGSGISSNTDGRPFRVILMSQCCNWIVAIVCFVADCSFSATLFIIRKRFREINLIIHRAWKQGSYLRVNILELSSEHTGNGIFRDLRILRKQYHNLWGIANRVNGAYGLHLLIGAPTSLTLISSNLWRIYTSFTNSNGRQFHNVVRYITWSLFYVTKMFLIVTASESTVAEAKATSDVLQELGMNVVNDRATENEIRDFLTQIQSGVRKFTACGFFDIDFTLIGAIFGAACTYLVILIQIDHPNTCVITGYSNESLQIPHRDHA